MTIEHSTAENLQLETPFEHIALAFSGGGFRAASFSLGVLAYLNHIRVPEADGTEKALIEKVTYISSASGGTITNAYYALCKANGRDFSAFYKHLYESMDGEQMLSAALDNLNKSSRWKGLVKTRNIINSFALSYDTALLFNGAKVGELSKPGHPNHLEEVCFNSTEFYSGQPFRQAIKMKQWPEPHDPYFHYGNHIVYIEGNIVDQLKLADLMAASSCFPGGFEPIELPGDFTYPGLEPDAIRKHIRMTPQKNSKKEKAFIMEGNLGLMDGGITDNQGLESLMNADRRRRGLSSSKTFRPFDLALINDVGSYYMSPYSVPKKTNRPIDVLTINNIRIMLIATLIAGIAMFCYGFTHEHFWFSVTGSIVAILSALIVVPMFLIHKGMTGKNSRSALNLEHTFSQSIVDKLIRFLRHTPVGLLKQIMSARMNSVMMLTSDVFMKRIRQILYDTFYNDPAWTFRRKGNHIYDLSFSNDLNRESREQDAPKPAYAVQLVAEIACNMGTTLWFDDESRKKNYNMQCIIACGQFTTCYNLMGYISKLRTPRIWNGFSQQYKDRVDAIDRQVKADWELFQKDPLWLLNKTGANTWGSAYQPVDHRKLPFPDYMDPKSRASK